MSSVMEWNVDPILFSIGGFQLRYYSLLFIIGFILGYRVIVAMMKAEKLPVEWADKMFIYAAVATIIGARLGHCIFYDWAYYGNHIGEIFLPFHNGKFTGFAGLASHGAAIGLIIAMYLYSKRITHKGFFWGLDRLVVAVAIAGVCIRLGNLMNSEIVGAVTDVPWGFHFTRVDGDNPVLRHPAQLYEAFCYLMIFGILMYMYWKKDAGSKPGLLFGSMIFMVFLARFIIEFVKEVQEPWEQGMALNMGQLLSIPFVLIGAYFVYRGLRIEN